MRRDKKQFEIRVWGNKEMLKIQAATHSGKKNSYNGTMVEQYSLHDIHSLDEYDINIIDLSAESLWVNDRGDKGRINDTADLVSISKMIQASSASKIIIFLPQNSTYKYNYRSYTSKYTECCELKNMLKEMSKDILCKLYQPITNIELIYENTRTVINDMESPASFYFGNATESLLCSIKSNKTTVLRSGKVILSTLAINDYEHLICFFGALGLLESKEQEPEWFADVKMFDDCGQEAVIKESSDKIRLEEENIRDAKEILDKNKRLKSILYTTGDELVEVIFEILTEMVGCDLTGFVDKKKEDFAFDTEGITFIGEIKGVNPNIKNANITQLEVHYQDYVDSHPETQEDNLKALLIMNHQKNKPLCDREPVMDQQINLAKRNGSLIIETHTLLRLLEKYRDGSMTREEIIEMMKNEVGLLGLEI